MISSLHFSRSRNCYPPRKLCLLIAHFFLCSVLCVGASPHPAVGSVVPEIELITGKDTTTKLSSLRGKWVVLQYGGSWHRASRATGQIFIHIREALEGKHFEYVEIFDDPTYTDMELFTFGAPIGLRALVTSQIDLEFFRPLRRPTWFVVDPEGVVRAVGTRKEPSKMRKEIGDLLTSDPTMGEFPYSPSPQEAALEKMMFLYLERNHEEAEAEAQKLLENDPSNEIALRFLLFAAIWTQSYSEGNKLLATYLEKIQPSDQMLIFQSLYRYIENDNADNRAKIRKFAGKYPMSRYLQCIELMFEKLPEDLTREEEDLLISADNTTLDEIVAVFRGFVLQSKGWHGRAEAHFRRIRSQGRLGRLALVLSLKRQGRDEEAAAVVTFDDHVTPENADPLNSWTKMHQECVLQNWEQAETYARRYQIVRPEKAQGYLVGWLAAKILGKHDVMAESRDQALTLMKSSDRYGLAADLLKRIKLPDVDDLVQIDDINVRFDTAMLFIMLTWEKKHTAAIDFLAAIQPAFGPDEWPYAALEQLRTDTFPKILSLNSNL